MEGRRGFPALAGASVHCQFRVGVPVRRQQAPAPLALAAAGALTPLKLLREWLQAGAVAPNHDPSVNREGAPPRQIRKDAPEPCMLIRTGRVAAIFNLTCRQSSRLHINADSSWPV